MAELTIKLTEKMVFDRQRCNEDSNCSECSCCMANDECLFNFTEERKVGKWEYTGSYDVEGLLKCTICGHEIDVSEGYYKFCPMCGAEMEGNNEIN